MDISYTDSIVNTIRYLRSDIYSRDDFKNSISNKLHESVGATDFSFIPEKLGGYSIHFSTPNQNNATTDFMVNVVKCLTSAINEIDNSISCISLGPNIVNMILMGSNGVVLKI